MTAQFKNMVGWVLLVFGLALTWFGLVAANNAIFQHFIITPYASFIYLPAALRVIFPLVFQNAGYSGIILGSFWVALETAASGILDMVFLPILSGLAPFIGIYMFKMVFATRPDLADLKPMHIFALAVLCAASNALILEFYFAVSDRPMPALGNLLTIFIGDISGTVILVSLVSIVLTFFISRRRV